ncbi:DUF6128 domain-containing protein [Ventrimonas sp. CLA-AP-H27]|uniref:DUF6128 domain-containing protein n=1 Tax=Ventrimonas faecis TaxID=3133170 RepID=A0ABV1HMS9_9FIRM
MSDYRRLISYIYAYEGGEKGKNIGFAKIDMRGPQCRIQVNVKKVYVGSSDVGVYLLHTGGELLLGRIFIRSGAGEYRTQVQSENVDGSGLRMEDCYGLTIHEVENAWQSYTTIWEDAVAQTAEIQLAEVTAENLRKQKEEQERKEKEPREREAQKRGKLEQNEGEVQAAELEGMPEKAEGTELEPEPVPAQVPELGLEQVAEVGSEPTAQETAQELPISAEIERELEAEAQKLETTAPWGEENEDVDKGKTEPVKQQATGGTTVQQGSAPGQREPLAESQQPQPQGPEDAARLAELDREENEEQADINIWKKMSDQYTKVLAFDYDNGCEILSIKPQDIGLLPREIWTYGNNSFLLHGYYNYRHLILAKLLDPQRPPRYLLGVPGHYFSNEKYMASMFGFPHFVLARKQPQGDGRFGYWYTDIRL